MLTLTQMGHEHDCSLLWSDECDCGTGLYDEMEED